MNNKNYSYSKKVKISYERAIISITEELKKHGFGILTKIDMKATLKEKIDADIDRYIILGACNPNNAFKAIKTDIEIGLLLPCNIIVYEKNNEIYVSAIKPTVAMSIAEVDELYEVARNIENKLKKAIDAI